MPEGLKIDITFAFEKCIGVFKNPLLSEIGQERNS